jgi:ELWxxDGT repeat protein
MNRYRRAASSHAHAALAQALEPRRMLSAFLLKDVNTTPPIEQQQPTSPAFVALNQKLLFGALDGANRVLYRSDGTPAGTAPLHPVRPGTTSGVAIGGVVFFAGFTPDGGAELWKTDGTAAGTARVKDILPGTGSSNPTLLTNVGGILYFTAVDPDHGRELWKSDGTDAGTVLVAETAPGPSSRTITEIQPADGTTYFATLADTTVQGGLWKTDGTPAGTTLLLESRATPTRLEALGSRVVFLGYDGEHGQEPWVSDGTPDGTRMLKDVNPFGGSADNSYLVDAFRFGDAVYFSANDSAHGLELWKTDGTTAGSVLVKDLLPGFVGSDPINFVSTGGVMYFIAHGPTGGEIWRSDGTDAGTTLMKDGVNASQLTVSGSSLYFAGPREVWKSDGTTAGTVLLRQFNKYPYNLTPYRGGVAFLGDDGPSWEPWFSDGTPAGTVMLGDFDRRTQGSGAPPNSFPINGWTLPVSLGDRVLFAADINNSSTYGTLWVTDGNTAGTTRLSDAVGVKGLTRMGDAAYFFANTFQGVQTLWRTDGTPGDTAPVLDTTFIHGDPKAIGNTLYFGAKPWPPPGPTPTPAPLFGFYGSDGTPGGTRLIKAMPTDIDLPSNFTAVGDFVYFTAFRIGSSTSTLWKSDGTGAGTVQVGTFPTINPVMAALNGKLIFRTEPGPGAAPQVWATDGTAQGTVSLGAFAALNATDFDTSIVSSGGAAYFAAAPAVPSNQPGNIELWKTDGTPGGTVRVKDIRPGTDGSAPRGLTSFDGRLYFAANDGAAGTELWSTDGTEAGTSPVLDLWPGATGSFPKLWGVIQGRLYFTANDGVRGYEVWSTDGTAAGTQILADVDGPGVPPVAPVALSNAAAGDRVIFWADDGVHGMEPWSAPLPGTPANDFVRGRHLFYNNSRFDGRTPGAARADDGAIAPDKGAYVPADGGTPGFNNVSGYARGLNGLMIDVDTRLPGSGDVVMKFDVGTGAANAPWTAAPTPLSVTRRNDGLPEDLDRLTVIWPDGAIRNTWLRVTLEATLDGAVVGRDVFYFGHLAGETGDAAAGAVARVTASDLARTRAAVPTRSAGPDNPFDHNRDGVVNVLDVNVVRGNFFATLPAPTTAAAPSPAARMPHTRYRPGVWAGLSQ